VCVILYTSNHEYHQFLLIITETNNESGGKGPYLSIVHCDVDPFGQQFINLQILNQRTLNIQKSYPLEENHSREELKKLSLLETLISCSNGTIQGTIVNMITCVYIEG